MFRPSIGRLALACALAAAGASGAAQAQTLATPTPGPSSSPALSEIGHVTTSDRRAEPIGETTRPTFVVDRAQIEAFGATTVAQALQGVPGVELFRFGPFGAQVDYGIRGALPAQTLVLVDGVPIADPTTAEVELDQLSTIGVERIEIVESGASTLYGTSASGGVINVITSVPRGAYLAASTGSFGERDVRFSYGDGHVGAGYDRHVATNDYPYPTFAYGAATVFPAGTRSDAFADESAARLAFSVGVPAGVQVRGRIDLSATQIGVPGSLSGLTPNATQNTSLAAGFLDLERVVGAHTLSLTAAGSQTRLAYVDQTNGGEDDVYAGRSQLSLKDVVAGKRTDLVAGIDLARESGIFAFPGGMFEPSVLPSSFGAAQSQSAAYAQLGYTPFAHARVVGGLRAENDAPRGSVLDPAFGGSVQSGAFRLAGNVAESFRVPTLDDLYYPGFSNPSLVPEKAFNSDVTLAAQVRRADVSLGWFARSGSNFIVFDPVSDLPVNESRAQTAGLVATASYAAGGGLVVRAGLTDLYRALDLTTGARLPRNPVGQATLSVMRPFGASRFAFGARYAAIGSDGDDQANVPPPVLHTYDAYASLDAYVRYRIAPSAILSVRGANLTNVQAAPVFGYPAPGRSWEIEAATR